MNVVSYSDLLRFTLPEIVVTLAGLLLLTLDISVLRKSSIAARFRSAALIACALTRANGD